MALAPNTAGETYAEHATPLLPAVRRAGLGWLGHIVAIIEPSPDPAARRAGEGAGPVEFLVFAVHRSRHE
jgi:hypothetical protein